MHLLRSPYKFAVVVITCFIIELLLLTMFIGVFGPYVSPLIFFVSSLVIGVVGIRMSFHENGAGVADLQQKTCKDRQLPTSLQTSNLAALFILIICIAISVILIIHLIKDHPVDVKQSDIIPQTQVLVERFLHKQFPYTMISNWGYYLFPTYQPLQWLPYTLAEYIQLDYRLFAYCIFLLVLVIYFIKYKTLLSPATLLIYVILTFLPVLFIYLFQSSVYFNSLENLIVAYYLFLAFAILTDSIILTGVALVLCLLSRYSLVLWLPLFMFIILVQKHWKYAFWVFAICMLGLFIFYFLPFFFKDTTIFMKGFQYYTTAALAEWKGQSWQQPGDKPFQLFRGLGFAGWFYDHSSGTVEEKLNKYRILHLVLSSVTVLLLGGWYFLNRNKIKWKVFSLASLKITLAVFYSFIQIPYDYLYLTLLYLSIPLIIVSLEFTMVAAGKSHELSPGFERS